VLRPAEMPQALMRFASHPYASRRDPVQSVLARDHQHFTQIINVLRSRVRQDFNGYKKPTVVRRIQRRMGLHQLDDMGQYVTLLRQNPQEATALSDDLMIHVTGFFRDPEAWQAMREQVIAPLVRERETGSAIRCWVAACSSGEEAYTLAILLS